MTRGYRSQGGRRPEDENDQSASADSMDGSASKNHVTLSSNAKQLPIRAFVTKTGLANGNLAEIIFKSPIDKDSFYRFPESFFPLLGLGWECYPLPFLGVVCTQPGFNA